MGRTATIAAALIVPVLLPAGLAAEQETNPQTSLEKKLTSEARHDSPRSITATDFPGTQRHAEHAVLIDTIAFVGLRRIRAEALLSKMLCHDGDEFFLERLDHDVHTLGRLGWFDSVRVERQEIADPQDHSLEAETRVRLVFIMSELPFLTSVEYTGSRLISQQQVEKLLAEKKLTPKLGEPENLVALHHIAKEIAAALQELGHPDARVAVQQEISPQATAKVQFVIHDGPHVPVARVDFVGNAEISTSRLRKQMQRVQPSALFAGIRGKDAYTAEAFEGDRARILTYYQNHGYPEARVGAASIWEFTDTSRRWLPWPRKSPRDRLAVEIPVEAGPFYTIDATQPSAALEDLVAGNRARTPASNVVQAGKPYSVEAVESLRRAWQAQTFSSAKKSAFATAQNVEALRIPDLTAHTMHIHFRLSDTQPYIVRHLQFQGLHRFPDRYLRKRVPLKEGAPLDERALETGLARLTRTGYFKPFKKEDIRVDTNDVTHTADVTIHVEELGEQRISFLGGRGQFGSTLGLAYTLFNLLDREELISSRLEAGPESLQLALGLAKEGFLGSRGTLALSLFNMFLRPRLVGSVKGPFYRQQTEGFSADWAYALTPVDTFSVDYGISRSKTQYSLDLPAALAGLPASDVSAQSSSHSLGLGWERNTGSERIVVANSVSGGFLGGSENLLRGNVEYGRVVHDRIFNSHNAWAFRATFAGVGSYSGDMPLYARGFAGDQFVRGLQDGELGPYAIVPSISATGATSYSAAPAGANAFSAFNIEYRMPLGPRTEAATFFDIGSGRLLPNWLGPTRPSLFDATNGVLHGSIGLELRWSVPGVNVPLRVYWALNVLRLNRVFALPDGSLFRARNRFSALGWGLGSMF